MGGGEFYRKQPTLLATASPSGHPSALDLRVDLIANEIGNRRATHQVGSAVEPGQLFGDDASIAHHLSLPGERLGYVAVRPGCEGEDVLVDMMAQISRFTGHNCPPSIIQRAVSRCQKVTSDLSVYQTNMELLYEKLTALGFEVERPGGTFYIFPKALEEDANAFCQKAREFDLLLVPSDSFGVKGYVRLAYCIDTEKVKRSLPAFEKLAAAYRK